MAKKKSRSKRKVESVKKTTTNKKNMPLAIIALILNILIIPGLGSLIAGKIKEGIWQLVLAIVGAVLSIILVGIPIIIAAWVWGIVTGVKLIQEAR